MLDIATAPRNVGSNRWVFINANELSVHDSYVHAIQTRNKASWLSDYWVRAESKDIKPSSTVDLLAAPFLISEAARGDTKIEEPTTFDNLNHSSGMNSTTPLNRNTTGGDTAESLNSLNADDSGDELVEVNPHYESLPLDDLWDVENSLRVSKPNGPFRIMKPLLTPEYLKTDYDLLKVRFSTDNGASEKIEDNSANYWILKQKRYKKKQNIGPSHHLDTDFYDMRVYTIENAPEKFKTFRYLVNSAIADNLLTFKMHGKTDQEFMDSFAFYRCVRNNKKRGELLPVTLSRRLLRTKKTLVLPAHVNMTLVTNSYDVVHS